MPFYELQEQRPAKIHYVAFQEQYYSRQMLLAHKETFIDVLIDVEMINIQCLKIPHSRTKNICGAQSSKFCVAHNFHYR